MFVEANVKKWGLAPVQGTLAPPPAYGYEAGSLLLERGRAGETSHLLGNQTISYQAIIPNDDDDDDDNTPLIRHIPIPRPRAIPVYSPPSYSTFPRNSLLITSDESSITDDDHA